VVLKTLREKLNAVADEIAELYKLRAFRTVRKHLHREIRARASSLLKKRGFHQVLNAKPMYAERCRPRSLPRPDASKACDHFHHMAGAPRHPAGGNPKFMASDLVRLAARCGRNGLNPGEYER